MPDQTGSLRRGYRYYLTDEAILKYMEWPVATRLAWLEEANRFLFAALSEETMAIREAFRKGDI